MCLSSVPGGGPVIPSGRCCVSLRPSPSLCPPLLYTLQPPHLHMEHGLTILVVVTDSGASLDLQNMTRIIVQTFKDRCVQRSALQGCTAPRNACARITRGQPTSVFNPHPTVLNPQHGSLYIDYLPFSVHWKSWSGYNKWRVSTAEVRSILLLCLLACE